METITGEEISQPLPPFRAIKIKETIAAPLKTATLFKKEKHVTLKDMSHIIEQNNYTNTFLHSISNKILPISPIIKPNPSPKQFLLPAQTIQTKLPQIEKPSSSSLSNDFLEELLETMKSTNLSDPNSRRPNLSMITKNDPPNYDSNHYVDVEADPQVNRSIFRSH